MNNSNSDYYFIIVTVAGVTGAKAATLAFLVGGTEAAFVRAEPFLAHMGRRIVHCGPSGSGLVAKICNNLMLGVQQVVTAEVYKY